MSDTTRLWFVTDVHGSNVCFRKILNSTKTLKNPNVIVIGGDITGKIVVPIVKHEMISRWSAHFEGQGLVFESETEIGAYERYLADKGVYAFRCSQEESDLFGIDLEYQDDVVKRLKSERLLQWVELADTRMRGSNVKIFMNAGNDDPFFVDDIIDQSQAIVRPEGCVVDIDGHFTMISTGYSNLTPWRCPRDVSEGELASIIDQMARQVSDFSRCIFNFHCPPFGTLLDRAHILDEEQRPRMTGFGPVEASVGSAAVYDSIRRYQPCVGLHGHIHEQYCFEYIGQTPCFNPGSEYAEGILRGVFLELEAGTLKRFALTREEAPPKKSKLVEPGALAPVAAAIGWRHRFWSGWRRVKRQKDPLESAAVI